MNRHGFSETERTRSTGGRVFLSNFAIEIEGDCRPLTKLQAAAWPFSLGVGPEVVPELPEVARPGTEAGFREKFLWTENDVMGGGHMPGRHASLCPDMLAHSYLKKATLRLGMLEMLKERGGYSDVVHEAYEAVTLVLAAVLRSMGMEAKTVPRVYCELLPDRESRSLEDLVRISEWLQKEYSLSFYGAEGFVPTQRYDLNDAQKAIEDVKKALSLAGSMFGLAHKDCS